MPDPHVADLQAQIVALRVSLESAWLSLLAPDPQPVAAAQRLGEQHVAALRRLDASGPDAKLVQDAVVHHTEQLWGSIAWQLSEAGKEPAND